MKQGKKIPKESSYPYSPYYYYYGICSASGVHISDTVYNYYGLGKSQLKDLLQDGPIAISLSADGWDYYGSGIFSCSPSASVNHAVLLVGYTSDYWIIKNQWGSSWGEGGYMRITTSSSNDCQIGTSAHIF